MEKIGLPVLMEHVRLSLLASTPNILNNVVQKQLLKNNPKCKCYFYKYSIIMNSYILLIIIYLAYDFVLKALQFYLQKSVQHFFIPNTIWCRSF